MYWDAQSEKRQNNLSVEQSNVSLFDKQHELRT